MYTITYLVEPAGKVALIVHVREFSSWHNKDATTTDTINGISYVTTEGVRHNVDKDRLISIVPYVHRAKTRKISG